MKISKNTRIAVIGILSVGLVAGVASVASAATQTNGSDGAVYIYDSGTYAPRAPGYSFAWNEDVSGSPSATDPEATYVCPSDTTVIRSFISTPGTERNPNGWLAYAEMSVSNNTTMLFPMLIQSVSANADGLAGVKAAGGNYSFGFACLKDNGVNMASSGINFSSITVTAGTGAWTAAAPADATASATPTPVNTDTTGSVALSADTVSAVEGVLSLSVPVNAAATFGAPTLVNNKSTTTGTLGDITVADGRVNSRSGWDLNASVADFVNSVDAGSTISKGQLGIVPKIISTEATGVTAGVTQVAGAATYSSVFASGAAANTVGNTVLNADLTFVAPQSKAAGTYVSTLTLTVVSK